MKSNYPGKMEWATDRIVAAIRGSRDIMQAIVGTVTELFTETMKDTGRAGASLTDVVTGVAGGVVRGVSQLNADLGHAGQGLMLGMLRGTKEVGAEGISTIRETAAAVIHATASVGGNLQQAATGLIQGAIQGAKEVDVASEVAVRVAAEGALKAAEKLGSTAVKTVRIGINKASVDPAKESRLASAND
jgi:hypothetical protein